jgi:hypothetical protein
MKQSYKIINDGIYLRSYAPIEEGDYFVGDNQTSPFPCHPDTYGKTPFNLDMVCFRRAGDAPDTMEYVSTKAQIIYNAAIQLICHDMCPPNAAPELAYRVYDSTKNLLQSKSKTKSNKHIIG